MKMCKLAVILLLGAGITCTSAQIEHEKLLPNETVLVITVPDYEKLKLSWEKNPQAQLFKDPSIQAAKEKFLQQWRTNVVEPLEKELGIKFSDYAGITKGQVTFAVPLIKVETKQPPVDVGFLLLMESGENKDKLTKAINGSIQKYVQSGHSVLTNKISDADYYEITIDSEEVSKIVKSVFPDPSEGWESLDGPKPKPKNVKQKIFVSQMDSLLVVCSSTNWIEKVILNKTGKSQASLIQNADFKKFYDNRPKESLVCGWANIEPVLQMFLPKPDEKQPPQGGFNLTPGKIINALGIGGIKGIETTVQFTQDGGLLDLFLRCPENEQTGLIKALIPEQKDSNVPQFVPSNVVSFVRYRLDMQKAWNAIETTLEQIDPKFPSVINLMLQTAGKAQDPNFDWRKNLLGSLGDDIVVYVKNPSKATVEHINNESRITLISSTKPEQLVDSVKVLTALTPKPPEIKEREIAGKKVYYWESPRIAINPDAKASPRFTFITSSGNYLVVANELSILQEYLNYSEGKSGQLKNLAGLNDAIEKAGGGNTGLTIFQNSREQMRFQYNLLKNDTDTLASILAMTPIGIRLGLGDNSKLLRQWIDPTLLPDFSKIEKYFYITVSVIKKENEGIRFRSFTPIPPELKSQ